MFRLRLFSIALLAALLLTLAAPLGTSPVQGQEARIIAFYADFRSQPFDPSIYDNIHFFGFMYTVMDGNPIWTIPSPHGGNWNFGDGTTFSEYDNPYSLPTHQYSQDGDYTVRFSLYPDPCQNLTPNPYYPICFTSTGRVISVRTHDVSIVGIKLQPNMKVGQVHPIKVDVVSQRYDEPVEVQLYKSLNGGAWQMVASLTQTVPVVLPEGEDFIRYHIPYTVQPEDAQAALTFKAVAVIAGLRDALPADNVMLSAPAHIKE